MTRTRSKRARSPASSVACTGGADPDSDAYFQRLIAEQIQADISAENPPSESEDEILDDDDSLSVGTVDSSDGEKASDGSSVRDAHDPDDVALDDVSETGARDSAQRDEIAIAEGKEEETNPPPPSLPLLAPDVANALNNQMGVRNIQQSNRAGHTTIKPGRIQTVSRTTAGCASICTRRSMQAAGAICQVRASTSLRCRRPC